MNVPLVSTEQRMEYREQTADCEQWLHCNKDKESTADFVLWNNSDVVITFKM